MTRIFYMVLLSALLSACGGSSKTEKEPSTSPSNIAEKQVDANNYYANGQVKMEGSFDKDGLKNGIWISYFENGKKNSESGFKNGINHGYSMVWYPNGNVRYFGDYKNGKRVGEWTFYSEDGEVIKTDSY